MNEHFERRIVFDVSKEHRCPSIVYVNCHWCYLDGYFHAERVAKYTNVSTAVKRETESDHPSQIKTSADCVHVARRPDFRGLHACKVTSILQVLLKMASRLCEGNLVGTCFVSSSAQHKTCRRSSFWFVLAFLKTGAYARTLMWKQSIWLLFLLGSMHTYLKKDGWNLNA